MIQAGVIGLGYWGPNWARVLSETPGCRLAACVDLDAGHLQRMKVKYPGAQTARNYSSVLKRLDAVVVATPPSTHFAIARDALEQGLDVLVEKPLALNSADALALAELAEKNKRVLMVGNIFEYNSAVNKIHEYVRKKKLGRINYMYSMRLGFGPIRSDANVLWDLAPHDLSIATYVTGRKPVRVSAHGASPLKRRKEDVAFVNLQLDNGVVFNMHLSWINPLKVRKFVIVGSKRMLVYDDVEPLEKIRLYDCAVKREDRYDSFGEFQLSYNYGDVLIPKLSAEEPLKTEARHFLDCVKKGSKPRTGGRRGLEIVRMLESIQRSMDHQGREIPL